MVVDPEPLPPQPSAPGAPDLLPLPDLAAPPLLPYYVLPPDPGPVPPGRVLRGH
jgi:hypothetical protein